MPGVLLNLLGILVVGTIIAVGMVFLILLAIRFFRGFFRAIGWVISHFFSFIVGMISDSFRVVGALLAAAALSLLVVLNVVIARWSNANHFGRAFRDELTTAGRALYRVCIGHPAKFLLLSSLTEGVEVRVVNAMAAAPGTDKPSKRMGEFAGYTIVGSLKGGGSGGKLFVAEPDERKRATLARQGVTDLDQVVIKSFSLKDGSSMPQIVRESRALEAAKKLGLVLEHELSDERFYYVMPYVPGESLGTVTQRLHAESGSGGLAPRQMQYTLGLIAELLRTLSVYHRGGLWHKDIKPDNIIVNGDQATLVDLGLVTPLRSAMTLTTHGTEYFRDPEMVRMALRGAKVHEVDGVKFDIYGAGAVLFSAIENSFPGHGGLSQLTKRCPEALRWIIRRSMAELSQRYRSAEEMLADLRVVLEAPDPFALKPKDLPSMGGQSPASEAPDGSDSQLPEPELVGVASTSPPAPPPPPREPDWVFAGHAAGREQPSPGGAPKPRFRVQDWLTGRYTVENIPVAHAARSPMPPPPGARRAHPGPVPPVRPRRHSPLTAAEQRAQAQERVRAAQQRVRDRRSARNQKFSTNPNRGVLIGSTLGVALLVFAGFTILMVTPIRSSSTIVEDGGNWAFPSPSIGLHVIDPDDRTTLWLGHHEKGLALGTRAERETGPTAWIRITPHPAQNYPVLDPS
ncbi:MAG: serine/threonine protein kinase, partial [Phycisphaerales bacterium]